MVDGSQTETPPASTETPAPRQERNRPPPSRSAGSLLHEIFEARADAHPDAVAVAFGPRRVTYEALERLANRIARHLRARGVARGSRVALLLPRSPQVYAALLGILKSGAAYVPIDPECPVERLRFVLEDAAVDSIVTTAARAAPLGDLGTPIVCMDADHERLEAESSSRLSVAEVGGAGTDLC
ncbi:MAG TPA: AMP-binding protein, partial [Verrucomicrobiae bacterium]|nr:AMP-binding protein [Verrucomicrobiae bacterium]